MSDRASARDPGRTTEFKVKVRSPGHFAKVFDPRHLPFDRIYVRAGNTLKCQHQGAEFTIVNVGWADPSEFREVGAFLADPSQTFHTGQEVTVDGGYTVF